MNDLNDIIKEVMQEISLEEKFNNLTCQHEECAQKANHFIMTEKKGKKDKCYYKVKARYDVWPSAYASGALVKCRKVGAANWGNKSKSKWEYYNE